MSCNITNSKNNPFLILHEALNHPCFQSSIFRPELVDSYDWTIYPWNFVTFLLTIWCLGEFLYRFLNYFAISTFHQLDTSKKRIVVTYFAQILIQTCSIYIVIQFGLSILLNDVNLITFHQLQMVRVSLALIGVLYIWELTYRTEIGAPLLIHHHCTIILLQLAVLSIQDTKSLLFLRLAVVMGLHANTEQIAMFALLSYRFKLKIASKFFVLAAGQAFVVKSSIFGLSWILFRQILNSSLKSKWIDFWKFAFPILNITLFLSQIYAVHILTCLAWKSKSAEDNQARVEKKQQNETLNKTNKVTTAPMVVMNVDKIELPDHKDRRRSSIFVKAKHIAQKKLSAHISSYISDQSVLDEHVDQYF